MTRLACPHINGLKLLIKEAFDEMPAAEAGRLHAIEATLISQLAPPRRSLLGQIPAWMVLLMLVAGTATAWWAGKTVIGWLVDDEPAKETLKIPASPASAVDPANNVKTPGKPPQKDKPDSADEPPDSAIIYQREVY